MKIGIVQGVLIDYTPDSALEMFKETNKVVETWAKNRGYGYHLFTKLIKPESAINSPDNFVNNYNHLYQMHVYKYWWLKSVSQDYDLVCWLDSDLIILGDPDIFSLGNEDKFNVTTRRTTYTYLDWTCEIPWGCFLYTNTERLLHFTNWLERVLSDRAEQSDTLITIRTILGKIHDEHLLACYMEKEGKDHVNLIYTPNNVLCNIKDTNNIISHIRNNRLYNFAGIGYNSYKRDSKFLQYKIIRTYVLYMKYLHASNKRDSKIRHTINSYTVEELDDLYNTTKSKLKELL